MQKLTFKEYLDSKQQLLKAIENTPVSILEYEIKKYCTLTLGESEEDKQTVSLKPKQRVVVEWHYASVTNPTPEFIRVLDHPDQPDDKLPTFWTGSKLQKWLTRHAEQGNPVTAV